MTRNVRILTTSLWALAILSMCALLASWTTSRMLGARTAPDAKPPPAAGAYEPTRIPGLRSPAFALTDQDGKPFSSEALKGKAWVADFFFTSCTGPCPVMSGKMAQLAKKLAGEPRVEFVSFSIDPETDTPAALKAYAGKLGASTRWHFLTGGNNATFDIARAMKLPAVPAEGTNPIFHSTKFVLVSPTGEVAGYYTFNDPAALEQLTKDARALAGGVSE